MAEEKKEKKEKGKEAEIKVQRIYNVPLKKLTEGTPRHRKAKRAVNALKEFLARHMKADIEDVKIGQYLNKKIWEHGIKNIPHHVKADVTKDADGIVKAELVGAEERERVKSEKKTKVLKAEKVPEKTGAEEKAEKVIEKIEEEEKKKQEKAKEIEKEEIDAMKKEHLLKKERLPAETDTEKIKEKTVTRKIFAEAKRQRP